MLCFTTMEMKLGLVLGYLKQMLCTASWEQYTVDFKHCTEGLFTLHPAAGVCCYSTLGGVAVTDRQLSVGAAQASELGHNGVS